MSIDLFGIDFITSDNIYGVWFFDIKNWAEDSERSLFKLYYSEGEWVINLLFMRVYP